MVSFKHIGKLLIGVGTSEEYEITPNRILISALLVGLIFFGTIAVLISLASLII
jgi:hypothetical protein